MITLREALTLYLTAREWRKSARMLQKAVLGHHIRKLGPDRSVTTIAPLEIEAWHAGLLRRKLPRAKACVRGHIVRAFWTWVADQARIESPFRSRVLSHKPNVSEITLTIITLSQALKDYLNARQSEWSEKTYQGNLSSLTKHIAFLGPDMPVKSISHQDITNWSNYLKTRSPKLATASVARYQREARTFWYWLDKMDYNTQSPFRIKISSCIPDPCRVKAIATDDRDAMLYEAQQSGNNRDYAIMRFITDTGCRSGGVYRLRMENLNLEKKEAQIHEKGDKWHWVTFTEETAEAIRQWIEVRPDVDHDYVFTSLKDGRKLNPDSIYQLFQRVAERAGVEKNFNAHAWRHEVGQRYLRATGDPALARAKLNHSSVTVTLMYYANQDRDHLRDMTSKLSPTTPMQENNQ